MDCSPPGLPVHHQLLELAQTHVLRVGDAIQPSHPLLSPSPAFSLSQHQGLFQWVSSSHQVAKVLEFHWSFSLKKKKMCIKTPKLHCFYDIQNRDILKCLLETSIPMTYFHLKNQKQPRNLFFNLIYRILNLTQCFMTFSLYFGGKISA